MSLNEGDGVAGKEVVLRLRGGQVEAWVDDVRAAAEGEKVFLPSQVSFAGLVPLDQVILPATVHPRLWRLALHLGGSICIAVAAESPVKRQRNEATGCHG